MNCVAFGVVCDIIKYLLALFKITPVYTYTIDAELPDIRDRARLRLFEKLFYLRNVMTAFCDDIIY
jgi:hypothetical protein